LYKTVEQDRDTSRYTIGNEFVSALCDGADSRTEFIRIEQILERVPDSSN